MDKIEKIAEYIAEMCPWERPNVLAHDVRREWPGVTDDEISAALDLVVKRGVQLFQDAVNCAPVPISD